MGNENKLKHLIAVAMDVDDSVINESISSETFAAWDSLHHLNLILVLEEQFLISFTEDEVVTIFSYKSLKEALIRHGIDFSR